MQVYNFCAGPAMLPSEVLAQAQAEMLDWQGLGVSVMEVSHRGKPFMAVAQKAKDDLIKLMNIPDDYEVLFMHGGGRGQFSAVAQNFLGDNGKALYLTTGQWSKSAADEARKFANIDELDLRVTIDGKNRIELPTLSAEQGDYRYLHYCPNETVDGIELFDDIDSPWPIVADFSSTILSRKIDVSKFGVIYAGAQKNIGPSGLSIAIVKRDLLALPSLTPSSILDYRICAKHDSMFNTPPTYAIYLAGLVFEHLLAKGGIDAVETLNKRKAQLLYDFIDAHPFYENNVTPEQRSRMNATFRLTDESKDGAFLEQAEAKGLLALKGHRIVGGMRASIYNAMPEQGVYALIAFMESFANENS